MLVSTSTYKSAFVLLFLMGAPSLVYGASDPQPLGGADARNEAIENGVISRTVAKESSLVSQPGKRRCRKQVKLSYYLRVEDFVRSFIEIPTSNVTVDSSTIASKYLAGLAPVYDSQDEKVGTCSASFLCMQNEAGIYANISNYLSIDNGLVISWTAPATLINLELDSVVNAMVTERIVEASTKSGSNPFYGKTFEMIVSSDGTKLHFKLFEYRSCS